MSDPFRITDEFIGEYNERADEDLHAEYSRLAETLARKNIDIDDITAAAQNLRIAIPSWGAGTGGTRFARFPGIGEPRNVFEKIDDCATIQQLVRITPRVSLHIPWDEPDDAAELKAFAASRGLGFDAMNSNTFSDPPGQELSYKFGSLTHTDPAVRRLAIDHNLRCLEIGQSLGSSALTVWIADGSNFPGQQSFRGALERYMDSMREIYAGLPDPGWRLYIEHKPYEPAFYSTVINDWGTSYVCARELGDQALCLVDLGHHLPNTNIEMVVSRLIGLGKLGGFHFNDSMYGDDDLDSGAIHPFGLFLVFNELVDGRRHDPAFAPAYMLDQSHNVTDPIESLICSAIEVQRAYIRALLVDREELANHQQYNDALLATRTLHRAFNTDVSPILAMARLCGGGAAGPIGCYRASGYRKHKHTERPSAGGTASGIV